jgi:hypothetical protein
MVAFGSRTSTKLDALYGRLTVAVLAAAALSSGCNSESRETAPTPSPSASRLAKAEVEAAVLAAWRDEHLAYAEALRAMDPDHPRLEATAIDPLLASAKAFIALSKRQGLVARGDQDLGTPRVIELTPADDPTSAVVQACVHGGLILYEPKTSKPVAGTAGQVTWNHERTTLRLIPGIGWLVAVNEVRSGPTEATCTSQ